MTFYIKNARTGEKLDIIEYTTLVYRHGVKQIFDADITSVISQSKLYQLLPENVHFITFGTNSTSAQHHSGRDKIINGSYPYNYDQPNGNAKINQIQFKLKYIPNEPIETVVFYNNYNILRIRTKLVGVAYAKK
jgi:hypothetical protein